MDNKIFKEFVKAAQLNEKVTYDYEESEPYKDVINEIYKDVAKLRHYTLNGRFQDILIKLLKNSKYEAEGYEALLKDIEVELNKLIVPNIIMLPINFIRTNKIHNDLVLNDYINLFMPTKEDIKISEYLDTRSKSRGLPDSYNKNGDNLGVYFEDTINAKLNKGHILLAKDSNFFNYPTLTIYIKGIPYKVEKESGRIAEATYSILRAIDFDKKKEDYGWGLISRDWIAPAHTYVVYYQDKEYYKLGKYRNIYNGYSFRFNFSIYLDINTEEFLKNLDKITKILDLYIQTCFLDTRRYTTSEINYINKWNNAILMFNTAYEFASIEKFDSCVLILCSILESLFLKNEGRNKVDRLIEEIDTFAHDLYVKEKLERINEAIRRAYKYRNKIMHEGRGYEVEFLSSRSLNSYQGTYRGMKPFAYQGAVYPYEEIQDIYIIFEFIIKVLFGDTFVNQIKYILDKK